MACLVAAAPLCISRQRTSYTSMDCEDDAAKTDGFFDMICKYQSQRLDEQRAVLPTCPPPSLRPSLPPPAAPAKKTSEDDQLLEMLFKLQHSRLNEQRCEMPSAPHLVSGAKRRGSGQQQPAHDGDDESDDVSSSEEEEEEEGEEEERRDQLGELKPAQNHHVLPPPPPLPAAAAAPGPLPNRRRSTMPSEDFFNLIQHLQSTRIEDQRSPLPVLAN